jgi:hypothetical protein
VVDGKFDPELVRVGFLSELEAGIMSVAAQRQEKSYGTLTP